MEKRDRRPQVRADDQDITNGYEAIHMIRKIGQACWSAAAAKVGPLHRFILGLFAATS
jgi:hypothetical protein